MKTLDWTFIDKTQMPDGPWKHEVDKVQWEDPLTKLPCLIKRNQMGALCGYVGVAKSHPAYEKEMDRLYQDDLATRVEVHGGITFSSKCDLSEGVDTICHLPEPGEDDDVWWLGFDASHFGDFIPGMAGSVGWGSCSTEQYRDMDYMKNQCSELALQLKALA